MIYTIGYLGRTIEEVQTIIGDDGLLLDIRISPRSRKPGFSKKQLTETFGDRYEWLYELGNESNEAGIVKLWEQTPGLAIVQEIYNSTQADIYLMCACRDATTCHRHYVASLILEMGLPVKEYEDE